MYADLDELVLSGRLFAGDSRSSSPARSPSPTQKNDDWPEHADEDCDSSDAERNARIEKILGTSTDDAPAPGQSIGMGPGRTGVKGVIRDREEAQRLARDRRAREVAELNRNMEKASLGGKTFLEEEREREWERVMLEGLDPEAATEMAMRNGRAAGSRGKGRFGHLREVGVNGFVAAVEQEVRGVWVVVHIYDPSLDRCYTLDATLSRLARLNDDVKFLRTRAGALGFASLSSSTSSSTTARLRLSSPRPSRSTRGIRQTISRATDSDDDDPYEFRGEDEKDITDANSGDEEQDVDVDVLPTLLVYQDGILVHTWVRVDWEAGRGGVEELLLKHRVLQRSGPGPGNCGLPSDDEDLLDSDLE